MLNKTPKTAASRYGNRLMQYDEVTAYLILYEALFYTVSYSNGVRQKSG
ncbi:MAG: hypothetical protein ACI9V1_002749 [Spirosomataceae bacterium]|jgi:hypothetical protein